MHSRILVLSIYYYLNLAQNSQIGKNFSLQGSAVRQYVVSALAHMSKQLLPYTHSADAICTRCSAYHYDCFLEFCPKNNFGTNWDFMYQIVNICKKQRQFIISTFKIDITKLHFFFLICQMLVTKIEICHKRFMDKNFQKFSKMAIVLYYSSAPPPSTPVYTSQLN